MPHAEPALDESFESNWMESTAAAALFEMAQVHSQRAQHLPAREALQRLVLEHPQFAKRDAAFNPDSKTLSTPSAICVP